MKRRELLKSAGATALGAAMLPFLKSTAWAQAPGGTVVVLIGNTINSLDIHRPGTNRPSYQVAVNVYDRLVTFGTRKLADGKELTGIRAQVKTRTDTADFEIVGFGLADQGLLFITRVAGEDAATEKPLIDKFWQSLKVKL